MKTKLNINNQIKGENQMENIIIVLKEQEYQANLDFKALGRVQSVLRKDEGLKLTFQQIFEEVQAQNFAVVSEIVIQSILRVHKQLKREVIEDKLDLGELENVFTFVASLIENSLPKDDGKKK